MPATIAGFLEATSIPRESKVEPSDCSIDLNLLNRTIKSTRPELLHSLLEVFCKENNMAAEWLGSKLLVLEEAVTRRPAGEMDSKTEDFGDEEVVKSEAEEQSPAPSKVKLGGTKRTRSRYTTCKNCEQEYDVTENAKNCCAWHPGELEMRDLDVPYLSDFDIEDFRGPVEEQFNKEDFPEAWLWTCCKGDTEEEECMTGRHRGCEFRAKVEDERCTKRVKT